MFVKDEEVAQKPKQPPPLSPDQFESTAEMEDDIMVEVCFYHMHHYIFWLLTEAIFLKLWQRKCLCSSWEAGSNSTLRVDNALFFLLRANRKISDVLYTGCASGSTFIISDFKIPKGSLIWNKK